MAEPADTKQRVAVYAAGSPAQATQPPVAPGQSLRDDELGPEHVLVARCITERLGENVPRPRFVAPQRVRGRRASDLDLADGATLTRLLVWPDPDAAPELAVVLVNEPATPTSTMRERLQAVDARLKRREVSRPARILALASPELEAWLLADADALAQVLGEDARRDAVHAPESLEPGQARWRLHRLIERCGRRDEEAAVRTAVAHACNLDLLARRCRNFKTLRRELNVVVIRGS